ncbi:unannotated protein [freshwater metagenome]|uniref:Unannotated protein n=1 Tax=freshwater metagenome TaxID=449393 RepID=A0A6J7ELE2_9ZZZZ
MPVNVFVASRGNEFMRDIAAAFVEAASALGRAASLVTDRLPQPDGSINLVVAPHEFFVLSDASTADLQRAAAASVCICTEQPGTPWFRLSMEAARRGLLAFDINEHGTAALRSAGVNAHRLPFGAVASMSAGSWPSRDVDLLFMGSLDSRRGAALAGLAPVLWNRHSELRLFPFDKPVGPNTPGVVFGDAKHQLLRRSRLLLNVHRDRSTEMPPGAEPPAYFEWVRMVEAMANGCVVVSEPSEGHAPLEAGTHFISSPIEALADTVALLLADPQRVDRVSHAARQAVTVDLALCDALRPALALVESTVLPLVGAHVASGAYRRGSWRLQEGRAGGPRRLGVFRPYADILSRAKAIALADSDALRRLEAAQSLLHHNAPQHIERTETPAYAAQVAAGEIPEVSVLVTLYDYEHLVAETLDSIVASVGVRLEVVIVEDHATDHSRAVARGYLASHPGECMVLLAKDANEGLAAARNTGLAVCRAPMVMVMDADNLVYPTCLRRLADALQRDPGAAFAYSALEDFGAGRNVRSAFAWNPEWLCAANYIDAQAMIRRDVLHAVGGYRTGDALVFGWEDWELWLRLASSGERGVLVPEMLGRYRVQTGSMIGLTNLWIDESLAQLRALHPALPWPDQAGS